MRTIKRKIDSLYSLPGDFIGEDLDPIANKKISHLARYVYYTTKTITLEMATNLDRLERVELIDQNYSSAFEDEPPTMGRGCCGGTLPLPIFDFLVIARYRSLW